MTVSTVTYNVNVETVDKKLNVLAVLEKTKDMRATILRLYPNISKVAYKSKWIQICSWKKAHQNCVLQTKPTRATTVSFETKPRIRYSAMSGKMRFLAL